MDAIAVDAALDARSADRQADFDWARINQRIRTNLVERGLPNPDAEIVAILNDPWFQFPVTSFYNH